MASKSTPLASTKGAFLAREITARKERGMLKLQALTIVYTVTPMRNTPLSNCDYIEILRSVGQKFYECYLIARQRQSLKAAMDLRCNPVVSSMRMMIL